MKKIVLWITWILLTVAGLAFFANKLWGTGDQSTFLIGEATHGHHQIEMACQTCHSEAFGGTEVLQNACTQCHAAELKEALDAHPKSKFTNPRNADRVEILDARYCVTCHTEHQKEQTHAMGVTLPDDYCYHCHQETLDERESHNDLAFDSCATAGCHNYHDNRALYESFLVEHANQPWLGAYDDWLQADLKPAVSALKTSEAKTKQNSAHPNEMAAHPDIADEWLASSHAQAGVDCGGCHTEKSTNAWLEKPNHVQCKQCHNFEVTTFLQGKHGMRLSGDLSAALEPISTGESNMSFKADSQTLTHGCNSCHGAHDFNPIPAATDACLSCHNDEHSLAFVNSKHAQLKHPSTQAPLVTCASCHMPREEQSKQGQKVWAVNHNQNNNLRPNEKMIRSVCMHCHSLEFSIDALADESLIKNNFNGHPNDHVPSIDWALDRVNHKSTTTE